MFPSRSSRRMPPASPRTERQPIELGHSRRRPAGRRLCRPLAGVKLPQYGTIQPAISRVACQRLGASIQCRCGAAVSEVMRGSSNQSRGFVLKIIRCRHHAGMQSCLWPGRLMPAAASGRLSARRELTCKMSPCKGDGTDQRGAEGSDFSAGNRLQHRGLHDPRQQEGRRQASSFTSNASFPPVRWSAISPLRRCPTRRSNLSTATIPTTHPAPLPELSAADGPNSRRTARLSSLRRCANARLSLRPCCAINGRAKGEREQQGSAR